MSVERREQLIGEIVAMYDDAAPEDREGIAFLVWRYLLRMRLRASSDEVARIGPAENARCELQTA